MQDKWSKINMMQCWKYFSFWSRKYPKNVEYIRKY